MTNPIVKFENQDIELITVDDQPMMTECHIIKSDWFSEMTAELEQAKKTIKEQNAALAKIREILPLK